VGIINFVGEQRPHIVKYQGNYHEGMSDAYMLDVLVYIRDTFDAVRSESCHSPIDIYSN
jgi:hypothetical protein